MTEQKTPSKWWQFEQRVKIAWKNRKSDIIKDSVSDGNKLGIVSVLASVGSSVASGIPIIGLVTAPFVAWPLAVGSLVLGALAVRHYARAAYNDKIDTIIDKKIARWRKKPTHSMLAKTIGNVLKYGVGTVRLGALTAAIAGVATAAAAGVTAFGSTALAGTTALSMATGTLAIATAAIGIASPLVLLGVGIVAAGVGGVTAIKGKKIITNIGTKLQKSAQLSQSGQKVNSNMFGRFANGVTSSLKGLGADIFNVAAEKQAKEVKKKLQNAVQTPKMKK